MSAFRLRETHLRLTEIMLENHGKPAIVCYCPAVFGVKDADLPFQVGIIVGTEEHAHKLPQLSQTQHCYAVAGRAVFLGTQRVC